MVEIIYRFVPELGGEQPPPTDAEQARLRLEEGNRVFAEFLAAAVRGEAATRIIPIDASGLGIGDPGQAPAAAPFALVLGCSDARVPTELVFSQACNDLFVVRVAGNVLGSECLGSIDYALHHLQKSLKLLVVLGHSGCGAVNAAVDAFLAPTDYLLLANSHALRSVVDRIFVAVQSAARALASVWGNDVARRPGYRAALTQTTTFFNAALAAYTLHGEVSAAGFDQCRVVYGIYDLLTHRVGLPGLSRRDGEVHLSPPPQDADDFRKLAADIASSECVRGLLEAS